MHNHPENQTILFAHIAQVKSHGLKMNAPTVTLLTEIQCLESGGSAVVLAEKIKTVIQIQKIIIDMTIFECHEIEQAEGELYEALNKNQRFFKTPQNIKDFGFGFASRYFRERPELSIEFIQEFAHAIGNLTGNYAGKFFHG
jgi:hypothetical protein